LPLKMAECLQTDLTSHVTNISHLDGQSH